MRKRFLSKGIMSVMLVLAVFSLLSTSCTNLFEGLEKEDYWAFDYSDEEDRELIKGKWILKKVGFQYWDTEVDIPYVDTEDVPQTSRIESLQIDLEGEHMIFTFNFNQPTLVEYRTLVNGGLKYVDTWQTSLTIPHRMGTVMDWKEGYLSTNSGDRYEYNGEMFAIYDWEVVEGMCNCDEFYFYCLYSVKNVITDEKGKINRLIMESYPSYAHGNIYSYEFERE